MIVASWELDRRRSRVIDLRNRGVSSRGLEWSLEAMVDPPLL